MRKGFTLIELLSVIIILAVIIVIAVPKIIKVIDQTRIEAYKKSEEMMANAARMYLTSNSSLAPSDIGDISIINLDDLQTNKLMKDIKDSKSGSNCTGRVVVSKKSVDEYTYNPYLECSTNYKTYDNYATGAILHLDGYDAPVTGFWNSRTGSNNAQMFNMDGTAASGYNQNKKAYVFDGINDYMTIENSISLLNRNEVTFEFCAKKNTNIPGTTNWVLFENETYPTSGEMIRIDNSGQSLFYRISNVTYAAVSTPNIINNKVYYIAITRTGTNYKMYLDGTLVKQGDIGQIPAAPVKNINIQSQRHYGEHYSVRVYNRALTDIEIQQNYNIDKQRFGL